MSRSPVIAIGLDATELTVIERWCDEGKLPALRALRERGTRGALRSGADLFAGAVWPCFYSAREVPWHSIYHNKMWRQEHMRCEAPSDDWLPERPFWERLAPERNRIAVIDAPFALGDIRPVPGLALAGWQSHDVREQGAYPAELWGQLERAYGKPAMPPEYFGEQSVSRLRHTRDELIRSAHQLTRISEDLLGRERWDFFLTVFGAAHRGGHYLWDLSQVDAGHLSAAEREQLERSLLHLYQTCDEGVARLVARAPNDARILVFALHGMQRNSGWADRCADILFRILAGESGERPRTGLLYRLKRALPWSLVREVTTRLPHAIQHRLVSIWSARMFDWRTTRVFPLPMDMGGFIRLNVRGRERDGIVQPGAEYDTLCEDLHVAFLSFRDAATGAPIVRDVVRADELAPDDAPYRHRLPDLIVRWGDVSAIDCPVIRSERHGELRWEGGRLPSGRSGNHVPTGWFVAAGPGIPRGQCAEAFSTLDLAPTILAWLDEEIPAEVQGRPIAHLCA
ncbi:MAG: hypothetical protein ACREON_13795 [Gemmatimonadaceae bacterium]